MMVAMLRAKEPCFGALHCRCVLKRCVYFSIKRATYCLGVFLCHYREYVGWTTIEIEKYLSINIVSNYSYSDCF